MCDLDLWRTDSERPCSPEMQTLRVTSASAGVKPSVNLDSLVTQIEVDYRLVANMLNHLVELLSSETRQSAGEICPHKTVNDPRGRKESRSSEVRFMICAGFNL